ncbi:MULTISPECIES: glycosyltransferase [unclassified Chelatococcus]|uniref:glycosyltransferase n=1 Tax=unclassified Chelatococcus TaxID=2638111 RepID=UPI001BCA7693|nr:MULTISPECIES: glycosyltransferase [unclassified Chelatococcus]MBS7697979.1 glycosyltransferase [Chelatococcus sp. YT9]MBX3556703.1 glycosyltransferase [Chelatococcus sp.]
MRAPSLFVPPAGPALISRWPRHVLTLRKRGRLLMEHGEYKVAGLVWESLLRSLPRDAEARHCLGRIRALDAQAVATHQPKVEPAPALKIAEARPQEVLLSVHSAATARDGLALLTALEGARTVLPTAESEDLTRLHGPSLLQWLNHIERGDGLCEGMERRLADLISGHDNLILSLLRQIAEDRRYDAALAILVDLASRLPSPVQENAGVLGLIAAIAPDYSQEVDGAALAALLLGAAGNHGEAVGWWRKALSLRSDAANRRGLLAALRGAGDDLALAQEIASWLTNGALPDAQPASEQSAVVAAMRHLVQCAQRHGDATGIMAIERCLTDRQPGVLTSWLAASCALARNDCRTALCHLDIAARQASLASSVPIDIHAERALVLMRDHLHGEALEAFSLARAVDNNSLYVRRHRQLLDVVTFCGAGSEPLRFPECLVDVIMEEVAARPNPYTPKLGHVAMVSGSLGQGGGERQTQTMVRRLLKEPRIVQLTLLIRSVHLKAGDDFFFDAVKALPVAHHVYGRDWACPSDVARELAELANRPRLVRAIALLPHNMREDIIRLCRALWDHRPQAVHIWQDMHAAALACHIVGVPHFFIHRGSLSPDYWAQNSHQTATHFRPMRHCYRRLLERPDFVILNNSQAGCRTDQQWLDWPDASRFRVIYNAVDFAALGLDVSRNTTLRESLGIEDPATPVIGGSFRLQPVKRPMWWAEAARLILDAVPTAHFLIIGDGDMTDAVAAFSTDHGFRDRLHLPGRVSNVGDWYRVMDVKLLTSEREGIPNAIIEAQHFGVPVVATDVGGVAEAIADGESGLVVAARSPADYADAVIRILRDPAWRAKARQCAPVHVHGTFSLDAVVDQLLGLYGLPGRGRRQTTPMRSSS